jgi:hypothetical protein
MVRFLSYDNFLKYGRGWLNYDNFSIDHLIGKICYSETESSLLESVCPVQIMEADLKEKKVTERGAGGAEGVGILGNERTFLLAPGIFTKVIFRNRTHLVSLRLF